MYTERLAICQSETSTELRSVHRYSVTVVLFTPLAGSSAHVDVEGAAIDNVLVINPSLGDRLAVEEHALNIDIGG